MTDFPAAYVLPNRVTVAMTDSACLVGQYGACINGNTTSSIWPTANTALYVPFQIEVPLQVLRAGVRVATQSGNLDVGIYAENGKALVTKGSTAVGAAGLQSIDLTTAISLGAASPVLGPGTYYFAMNCDNSTASFFRLANTATATIRICGNQQQVVGALALPATATFATANGSYVPDFVLSGASVL